ncbi:MAG TPA: excinuclease ABC subunit UvrC [Candidatus Kapabacteria bacterium]|nr:excinuclease ABC subunit UvrC [Candidatus Kapabacteria bacterium]HPO62698.1 excinuclease ABC subunit UvrC [Candidatus Kapabacteria bacterium]
MLFFILFKNNFVSYNVVKKRKINLQIKEKIDNLPTRPGVYQFFNSNGVIIYVGKAKNLRNRVRSYFQEAHIVDAKTKVMVSKIANLEVIVVDSEAEALILENTLIKKLKPRYNILLRDDKSFPYIRITNEEYPRIFSTRQQIRDGSKYFGPYTDVRQMKFVMRTLRNLFQLRSCKLNITADSIQKKKHKLCLDYYIKKCNGPCEGIISKAKYDENIKLATKILNGKTQEIEKMLEEEMLRFSDEMRFEEAADMKDKLNMLKGFSSSQKVVSEERIDRDVIGYSKIGNTACILIFKVRDGKLIGKKYYIITDTKEQTDSEIIQLTIEKWYMESDFIPKEVLLPLEPEQSDFLLNWLKEKRGKTVDLLIPKHGDKKQLVKLASINAEFQLKEFHLTLLKRDQSVPRPVQSLQRDLHLPKLPLHIECFDNSHIQGSELVASMVVFLDGKPRKSEYRKYIINTVDIADDFASMREVVHRRYSRQVAENQKLPDLIIIDGGKGQLSSACGVLLDLNLQDKIPIISLAKRLDEVFMPGKSDSIMLPKTSSSLKLIQQLRDEAHRFAITFHRQRRAKRTLQTELTEIKGIGEKTAQKLLIKFGSVEKIKNTSKDDLEKEIGTKLAENILEHFGNI